MTTYLLVAFALAAAPPSERPSSELKKEYKAKLAKCMPGKELAEKPDKRAAAAALGLGLKLYLMKEYDRALPQFERCVQLMPASAQCVLNLVMTLEQLEERKDRRTAACHEALEIVVPKVEKRLDDRCDHPACVQARGKDPPKTYRGVPYP